MEFPLHRPVHQVHLGAGRQDVARLGAVPLGPDPAEERRGVAEIGLEARNPGVVVRLGVVVPCLPLDAFLVARLERADGSATADPGEVVASDLEVADHLPGEAERFPGGAERHLGAVLAARTAGQSSQVRQLQGAAEREPSGAAARQPKSASLAGGSLERLASAQRRAIGPVQPVALPQAGTWVDEQQVAPERLAEQQQGAAEPEALPDELHQLQERARWAPESRQSAAARLAPGAQQDAE